MRNPLTAPAAMPKRSAAISAIGQLHPSLAISATAAPAARPIIAPNEGSRSCITRMTVSPPAMTNIGAAAVRIDLAFSHVGNDPERATLNTTIITTKAMTTPYLARIVSAVSRPERRADAGRRAASSGPRATTPACLSTAISRSSSLTLSYSPVDAGAPLQRGTQAGKSRDSDPRGASQLPAGTDAELGEHVAQMPLDRPGAQEELRPDLRVRQPIGGKQRDLPLLRGQIVATLDGPPPHLLAGGLKLLARALGERLHADRGQHLVGSAQLVARVDPAVLAAQPLPVEQMSAGELGTKRGPCESLDGLAMQALGAFTLAQECPAARLYSPAPVGVAGRGRCHHPLEPTGRHIGFPRAGRRFHQLSRCPGGDVELRCLLGRTLGRGERPVIAAESVEEDRAHPLGELDSEPLTACSGFTDRGLDQWRGVLLTSERGQQQLGIRCHVGPGRLCNRVGLGDRDDGSAKVAAPREADPPVDQVDRQPRQRARVAGLPEMARADGMPAVLIPEENGWEQRPPAPAEVLLRR